MSPTAAVAAQPLMYGTRNLHKDGNMWHLFWMFRPWLWTKMSLTLPRGASSMCWKDKKIKKKLKRHVKKSQSVQNDACKTVQQKWRPEEQEYSLCSSLYLAGIDKSQASILTIHITVHDACPWRSCSDIREIKHLREKKAFVLLSLILDSTPKQTCYLLLLCMFVYARDLVAVLYMPQLDKATNDSTPRALLTRFKMIRTPQIKSTYALGTKGACWQKKR